MIGALWEMFKLFLSFLWPVNLYRFARDWRGPMHGSGMGPAIYTLFLPFMWAAWLVALAVDISIVILIVYGLSHVSVSFN
jgi:hypothetical protein